MFLPGNTRSTRARDAWHRLLLSERRFILRSTVMETTGSDEGDMISVMTLAGIIERTRTRFPHNRRFSLLPEEFINEVVDREKVPDARGVYIMFRSDDLDRPLYIGKAGTIALA